jgi:hypothetical protein
VYGQAGTGSTVTYTDTNEINSHTTYYYRVRAVNYDRASGYAGPNGIVTGDTGEINSGGAPSGPYGLKDDAVTATGVVMSFIDNSTNETGFVVERGASASGPFTQITTLPAAYGSGNRLQFADNAVLPGATYYYRVYAVNGPYQSSYAGPYPVYTPPASGPNGGTPLFGTPFAVGQVIEAEDFNQGGEGVAYHDSDASNDGGQYRPNEGVDIESTLDTNGGFDVGWAHTGEYLTYAVRNPTGGTFKLDARVANLGAGGSFHVEVDGVNVTGTLAVPDTASFQSYTDVIANGIPMSPGDHQVRIVMEGQSQYGFSGNFNWFRLTPTTTQPTTSQPYGGTPFQAGDLVEAENFDTGGEGVAYHDTDASNNGGQYRPSEGVDIESSPDLVVAGHGSEYDVGWTHAGEWMNYTGTFGNFGNGGGVYDLYARVANVGSGGSFHVNVDGVNVTGSLAIPDNGGYQNYTFVTKTGIPITAGQHVVQIVFDGQATSGYSGNLNYFRFAPETTGTGGTAYNGTPATLPGVIQAENFDVGGEGVAYHDSDATNLGGAYRPSEGVDIETTNYADGYALDWTHAGEWLQYTVNITETKSYDFSSLVSNDSSGGAFHVTVDGADVTGSLAVPNTGSWRSYAAVTKSGIPLTAGRHTVRVYWDANNPSGFSGNLDYIAFI